MKGLRLDNLVIGYGKTPLSAPINLSLKYGKSYGLLGLNGSGKTTLLKTILGLIPPISGNVLLGNQPLNSIKEKERAKSIAYMPQRYSKGVGMTAKDMVLMGFNPHLGVLQSTGESEDEKVAQTLALLGIGSLADTEFSKLSAGQQQLVVLSRALVQNTAVIIMDEPDSGLDYPHKHSVLDHAYTLTKQLDKLVLITLHDPNFALRYCDALIFLNDDQFSLLELNSARKDDIENRLRALYGNVEIIQHNRQYFMI